jgi:hypothetical protein
MKAGQGLRPWTKPGPRAPDSVNLPQTGVRGQNQSFFASFCSQKEGLSSFNK